LEILLSWFVAEAWTWGLTLFRVEGPQAAMMKIATRVAGKFLDIGCGFQGED
jgi:hypothetical protein